MKKETVDLSFMADKWPSAIVPRSAIGDFTGGLVSAGTLGNDDKGLTRIRRGQKVFYRVDELILWLAKDCHIVDNNDKTAAQLLEEKFEKGRKARGE